MKLYLFIFLCTFITSITYGQDNLNNYPEQNNNFKTLEKLFKKKKIDQIIVRSLDLHKMYTGVSPESFDQGGNIDSENPTIVTVNLDRKHIYNNNCISKIYNDFENVKFIQTGEIINPAYKFSFFNDKKEIINFYITQQMDSGYFAPNVGQYTKELSQKNITKDRVNYIYRFTFSIDHMQNFYNTLLNNCK